MIAVSNKMFTYKLQKQKTCSFKTVSNKKTRRVPTSYFEGCANAACKKQWCDIVIPPSSKTFHPFMMKLIKRINHKLPPSTLSHPMSKRSGMMLPLRGGGKGWGRGCGGAERGVVEFLLVAVSLEVR